MRLIHCADLHLDSKLNKHLKEEKRKERRAELLHSFERIAVYAKENKVEAILIAGDLFDTNVVSSAAKKTVWNTIRNYPDICFYYLKGNHDDLDVFETMGELPDNLKLFSDRWTYYSHPCSKGQIVIAGAELSRENSRNLCDNLYLHPDAFNIVMLHGQENEYRGSDDTIRIPLRELRNKNIDYLALGHVHSYKKEQLDARGTVCYPGCPEGRGFDECGEHGFAVLDIEEETGLFEHTFIPFAKRKLFELHVDITGLDSVEAIYDKIMETLRNRECHADDLIKIVLSGETEEETERILSVLKNRPNDRYYYVRICDETRRKIDFARYLTDHSLKGEYIRLILSSSEIPEKEKDELIRYGILALAGEELE